MDSLDVSLPAEAWERPLTGSLSVLPCTVLSGGIGRGLAMVDSGRSGHSVHMVERGMGDREKERGWELGFAFSPAFCQASLLSCGSSAAQFLEQHSLQCQSSHQTPNQKKTLRVTLFHWRVLRYRNLFCF